MFVCACLELIVGVCVCVRVRERLCVCKRAHARAHTVRSGMTSESKSHIKQKKEPTLSSQTKLLQDYTNMMREYGAGVVALMCRTRMQRT